MESPKCIAVVSGKKRTYLYGSTNYPVSCREIQGPEWKFAEIRVYLSSWYRVCTKAMFVSKGSYGYGETKNIFLQSVQKPYLPVRVCKLPRFMGVSIVSRMEICGNSGLPIPMVPRFYQSNVHIKSQKLRVWRDQKCNPLVGAKTSLTSMGPQTISLHGGQYRAENGNLYKSE